MPSAQEDAETTYFNESVDTAKGAVAEAFDAYEAVLNKLAESERAKLQRAMGLKMEQLKVQATQPLFSSGSVSSMCLSMAACLYTRDRARLALSLMHVGVRRSWRNLTSCMHERIRHS